MTTIYICAFLILPDLNSKPRLLQILDRYFNIIVPISFDIHSNKENVSNAIREFYFGNQKIDNTTRSGVTDVSFFAYVPLFVELLLLLLLLLYH